MVCREQGIRLNLIAGAALASASASASGGTTKAEAPSTMPHPQQSQWNAFKAGWYPVGAHCCACPLVRIPLAVWSILTILSIGMMTIKSSVFCVRHVVFNINIP